MGTLYVVVIIVTLSTHCSAYIVSHSETDTSIASVLLKEGHSAEISCMTKETGDFFWRKGETLYNSTLVASFTVGEISDVSQPYSVTVNGTLHIRSVTLTDEGNYFCRVSSTENECYGEVKILVQASLRHFYLAIDRCDGESSCVLYLDPSQPTSLTCTALNAAPLMTLKWFNGAKEITEGIEQNEILPQNGNSREITSTVTAVYGHPASLTCQAVDPKRSNDDIRFAHAQVEMTVPVHESLATWIIVAGTLAGCFIVYVIFSLIKARAYRTKYKTKKEENVGLLEVKMSMQEEQNEEISRIKEEQNEEISRLKEEQNEEISRLKEEQNGEISRLKDKLRKTVEELKKSKNDNIDLQTKTAKDEAKITYAEKVAKSKDQEMTSTGQELTKLKSKVPDQIQEISSLKGDVQSKAKAIAELETKLKQRDEEIKKEKNENLELQKKIANSEAEMTAAKESAKTKDQEIKNKNQELTDLKSKLPDQIQEMFTLKGDLESKAKSIAELEVKLKQQEEEINKERNANIKLQETIASAKGETTVAEDLVERRNKEISELKETVEQKDKEINNQREKFLDCQTNLQREQIASQGKSDDISKLKVKLKQQEEEINKERNANIELQTTTAIAEGETTIAVELAERRKTKISELKKKVEEKEKEINNQREKYSDCQTNLQKKEIDLQAKSFEISDLKSKLKEKDSELVEISKELTNLKEDLAKKEHAKEQNSS